MLQILEQGLLSMKLIKNEPMNNDNDCWLGQLTNIVPNCKWYRKTFKCILSTSVYVWTRVPLSRHQVYPIWEAQTLEGYLEKSSNIGRSSSSDSFHPLIFCKGGGDQFDKKKFLFFGWRGWVDEWLRHNHTSVLILVDSLKFQIVESIKIYFLNVRERLELLRQDVVNISIVESISVLIKTESTPPTEFTYKHISSSFHFGSGLVGK